MARQVVFLAAGTDTTPGGLPDLTQVWSAGHAVANARDDYKVIVIKSTIPVGTAARMQEGITQRAGQRRRASSSLPT